MAPVGGKYNHFHERSRNPCRPHRSCPGGGGLGRGKGEKLTRLLRLKYHDSIADAVTDLGAN
jgi:hypothetical protein